MMRGRLWLLIVLAVLVAGVWLRHSVLSIIHQPLTVAEASVLEVRPGDSVRAVLARAEQAGWLRQPRVLALWARWQGLDRRLHVGEYAISAAVSADELLRRLSRGEVIRYSVTIPEGITLAEAIRRVQSADGVTALLSGPSDPRLLTMVAPHASTEGWFLPETYHYVRGDTDVSIFERAHALMREVLDDQWSRLRPDNPLAHPYELLVLASIVERETSIGAERPQVAGVFIRRLQKGMRLQTDPTVIYGLGESFDGNLTRAHLRDDSNRWNTYRIDGLPPTPIALPGRAAVEASVHPDDGNALYFVARGDGYHVFAATLEEHNANVRQFQRSPRRDYRSTPLKER